MIRFADAENLNRALVRGPVRRLPNLDIVRVQDRGLSGADDEAVLQWAAEEERVLLTHDVTTMTHHAYTRVEKGLRMPGVFEVPDQMAIRRAIEDIVLIATCSLDGEWEGQVRYLPL